MILHLDYPFSLLWNEFFMEAAKLRAADIYGHNGQKSCLIVKIQNHKC